MDLIGRRFVRLAVILAAFAVIAAPLDTLAYYIQDPYNSAYFQSQTTSSYCVPASTRNWIKYLNSSFSTSQATIDTYETSKDKYYHASGHDPRGWAWGLYHYAPTSPGYTFNDYKWSSQATANWEMVWGIRATNRPVGAIVEAGAHAIDIIGYKTLNDPFSVSQQTLYGFNVLDPWFGRGDSGMPYWPINGFSPNYYVAIGSWNSYYFLQYNGPAYWNTTYVPVLQKYGTTAPGDNPTVSYGEYVYNNTLGPVAAEITSSETYATSEAAPAIAQAVSDGLAQHDLLGLRDGLGIDLKGYAIGDIAHVDSLAAEIAPYDLVELNVSGSVRAIALVTESSSGYTFGALWGYTGDFALGSATGRAQLAADNGVRAGVKLLWAPSTASVSPFDPFLSGESGNGQPVFVSSAGSFAAVPLAAGLTPTRADVSH